MFAPLPPSHVRELRRQNMGWLFGFCIQEDRKNAEVIEVDFDRITPWVLVYRDAWEL